MTDQAHPVSQAKPGDGLEAFAQSIEANREEICRQWVAAVDRSPQVATSDDLTFRQLLDHFPILCQELAKALRRSADAPPAPTAEAAAAAHAQARWQQGYRLDELIREISIVRREFTRRWLDFFAAIPAQPGQDEARRAGAIVNQFFDDLILTSVTQFVEEDQLRREAVQGELRTAEEKAAAASRAQTEMVALLGHELRTPLTPILLAAAALEEEESLPAELREFVEVVKHNAQIEAGLVDDLLEAARLANTTLRLHLERVNLHTCVDSALAVCAPDFAAKGITPTVQLTAAGFHVLGDPRRLKRIFVRLFRNAIQVTPDGGEIAITSRNTGGNIEVAVADSGSALDEEALRKLFMPFEEGRRHGAFGMGGIGAGLYVARAIVQAHGGEMVAEPRHPRGAILTVRLMSAVDGLAGAAWEGPVQGDVYWIIPVAITVLLVPSFFVSVRLERRSCLASWPSLDPGEVRRAVYVANLWSYAVLFVIAFGWILHQLYSQPRQASNPRDAASGWPRCVPAFNDFHIRPAATLAIASVR